MIQFRRIQFFRVSALIIFVLLVTGCAQYGMISENDVYMQKPTDLSAGEDESDLTSYNAYKARERGVYEDRYLIDQMYDRRYYGTLLYGGPFMGGIPFYSGSFISWGYMNPIRGYQNTFYYNSFYNWNRPWTYAYGYGYNPYNPYANGVFGYGYPNYSPYGYPYGSFPYGGNNMVANNGTASGNHFSGQKRFSLSSNAPRSSSYPATLKSNNPQNGGSSSGSLSTSGTSRRAAGKQSVQSSHMPFKNNSANSSSNKNYSNNGGANVRTYSTGNNRGNVSQSRSTRTQYTPSRSARNSGVTRAPRTTNNYQRSGYSNSSTRRTTSGSSSRSPSYNTRTRSVSSSSSRSVGGSRSSGSSSSSSSSSNSGRR